MRFEYGARFNPPAGQVETRILQVGETVEYGSNMLNLTLALGKIRERVTRLAQCPLNGRVALGGAVPTVKIKNRHHFSLTLGLPEETLTHHYRKAALYWVDFVLSDLCHVV